MEPHRIIRDEKKFAQFIDWLPELLPSECFYLCLQARRKYFPSLKSSDRTQLRRFTATKRDLASKVAQLECPVGCYQTRSGDVIPDAAIALYITPNPRCLRKATYATGHAMLTNIEKYNKQDTISLNPHSEALTQIHKAKSRSEFVHFDIDMPTGDEAKDANAPKCDLTIPEIYERTVAIVGSEAVNIVNTRGGCHVLIEPAKVVSEARNWHPVLTKEFKIDQSGDMMLPVVGCCQGDFVPHFNFDLS